MPRLSIPGLIIGVLLLAGCEGSPKSADSHSKSGFLPSPADYAAQYPTFDKYWYQGRAELTRYALRQHRYGDSHDGEAVLIFVTEPFLPGLQVKQEHGNRADSVSVLKLNAYRRFYTGIYPYTIMTSSFTPVKRPGIAVLKVTNTVQEWCGQAFTQVNRRSDGLHTVTYSYKQDEGDRRLTLPLAVMEDALWAQLRVDPNAIVEGPQEVIPALDYIQMQHKALRAYPAVVTRVADAKNDLVEDAVDALRLEYPPLARTLLIYHEKEFPYAIVAWDETIGPHRTTAVRTNAIIDSYWDHNSPNDDKYREALGVRF